MLQSNYHNLPIEITLITESTDRKQQKRLEIGARLIREGGKK